MNMNSKLTQAQLGVVSVFALTLALTSPAFAQCPGGVCRVPAQNSYAVRTAAPAAPCAQAYSYSCQARTCGQFQPFGGFFRNLFGFRTASYNCSYSCSPSGGTCLADPVGRESAPDATTDEEFATEKPEPGTDAALYDAVEKLQTEQCEESDNCEPCGAVRATWLEKKLFDCANRERRAAGLHPLLFDGRLIEWARLNSYRQASYCRLGHFTGRAAEIAGEGYSTPDAAVKGWLGSAPHRVILLNGGYTRCGCACYQGANGKFYWTMSFGN